MKYHRKTHSRILKNYNLKRAWQCTHNIENTETISISKGCEALKSYIISDSSSSKKRLSLDTSSKIIHGLTKSYKEQVDIFFREMHNTPENKKEITDTQESSEETTENRNDDNENDISFLEAERECSTIGKSWYKARSSSNAEYHNKEMVVSLDVSSIHENELAENYSTPDVIENRTEDENLTEVVQESNAESNNSQLSSKKTYDSHHVYEHTRHENYDDDDSSDNEGESNEGDSSSSKESEPSSENEVVNVNQSSNDRPGRWLSPIPEDSENVTSLHETEGNQELDKNVTDEFNMPDFPIIQTNREAKQTLTPNEQNSVQYVKSPIISWPTSQEFKNNNENNNSKAIRLQPLTLQIPTIKEMLTSNLLHSPIIVTENATQLQENPLKRKYFNIDPYGTEISENEKRSKKGTEESDTVENFVIDQDKSPIIPYKGGVTQNQNNKINLAKVIYIENSTQTENNSSDEELNKSDAISDNSNVSNMCKPVCMVLVFDNEADKTPRFIIQSKVNPHIMETLSGLATSM